MILPTKRISPSESLLGIGSILLRELTRPMTVNDLWEMTRENDAVETFHRFCLALDLLYAMGLIEYEAGRLRRQGND